MLVEFSPDVPPQHEAAHRRTHHHRPVVVFSPSLRALPNDSLLHARSKPETPPRPRHPKTRSWLFSHEFVMQSVVLLFPVLYCIGEVYFIVLCVCIEKYLSKRRIGSERETERFLSFESVHYNWSHCVIEYIFIHFCRKRERERETWILSKRRFFTFFDGKKTRILQLMNLKFDRRNEE